MAASSFVLMVDGRLGASAADILCSRFDGLVISRTDTTTAVSLRDVDQAALRAVLTVLWDLGHEVVSVCPTGDGVAAGPTSRAGSCQSAYPLLPK
jgi:hypothetical protein